MGNVGAILAHLYARLVFAMEIAAAGDQQAVSAGKIRIIMVMLLFMIIAEGLNAVNAIIDGLLKQIFLFIECLEGMSKHGEPASVMDPFYR